MRHASRLKQTAGAAVAVAIAAGAAAPAEANDFAAHATVRNVQASCLTRGPHRGRVVLDVSVRYADAKDAAAKHYAAHRTRSVITVRSARGALLARHVDRGTAQVAIPSLDSYVHTHRHFLSARQSRRVLAGRRCSARLQRLVRVKVRATQTLVRGATGSGSLAATAAQASASQTATRTVATAVQPAASIPDDINGCLRAGNDWNCQGVDLDGVDLSGQILANGDFSFASMRNANLQGARLGHVNMNLTVLDGANLKGALFGSASFTSTSLIGADLTGADGPYANLANANLTNATLVGAKLSGTNLPGTVLTGATCDSTTVFPSAFPHHCAGGVVVAGG